MKLIKAIWFTPMGSFRSIGIVITKNEIEEKKAYIGMGIGLNEERNANYIMEIGAPVSKGILEEIIKEL